LCNAFKTEEKLHSSYYAFISASLNNFWEGVHRISENLQLGSVVLEQVRNAATEDIRFALGTIKCG
jgi:hypothetical protein